MGYLNAVAGTERAPKAAAPVPSWRPGSPTVETEADEGSSEFEARWSREAAVKDDPPITPMADPPDQDETGEEPTSGESERPPRHADVDGPRLLSPHHQPLSVSDSVEVVLPEPTGNFAQGSPSPQEEMSTRIPPEALTPAGPDLRARPRPAEPTRKAREGLRRVAELRVPADAYPVDLVNSSPAAIRRWLSEHPELITPDHDETPIGITVEKLIFEQPPPRPLPESEPRERPQPRGFADYDSVRRR
jgi:hypothetical protein